MWLSSSALHLAVCIGCMDTVNSSFAMLLDTNKTGACLQQKDTSMLILIPTCEYWRHTADRKKATNVEKPVLSTVGLANSSISGRKVEAPAGSRHVQRDENYIFRATSVISEFFSNAVLKES